MIFKIINILHKNNLRYYRINWNIEEKITFYWMKCNICSENITVSAILSNTHACIPGFEKFSFGIYCKTFFKKINFRNQLYKWYHYFWICLPRISMMSLYSINSQSYQIHTKQFYVLLLLAIFKGSWKGDFQSTHTTISVSESSLLQSPLPRIPKSNWISLLNT